MNANIESVKVSVEGNPNSLYSQGLIKSDIDDDAQRFFSS